jgi:hypothetical protein
MECELFMQWKKNRNAKVENLKIIFLKLPIIGSLFRKTLFSQFQSLKILHLICKLPETWPYILPSVFDKDIPSEKISLAEILYGLPSLESLTIRSFNKSILFTYAQPSSTLIQPALKHFRLEDIICLQESQCLTMLSNITELVGNSVETITFHKCSKMYLSHVCTQLVDTSYPNLTRFEYVEDGYHNFAGRMEHISIRHPITKEIVIVTNEHIASCVLECPSLCTLSLHIYRYNSNENTLLLNSGSISTWKQLHTLSLRVNCAASLSAIVQSVAESCASTLQVLHLLNASKLFEETYQSITSLSYLYELSLVYNIAECTSMDHIVDSLCSSASLKHSLTKLTLRDCRKLTVDHYSTILDAFALEQLTLSMNFASPVFNFSLHEDDIGPMIDRQPVTTSVTPLPKELQYVLLSSDSCDYDYCTIVLKQVVKMIRDTTTSSLTTSFDSLKILHIEMIPYKDLRLERNASFEELNQLPDFQWLRVVPKLQSFQCKGFVFCDEFTSSLKRHCPRIHNIEIANIISS